MANHKISPDPINVRGIFKGLSMFFDNLHKAIGHIEIGTDGRPLTIYIGRGLEEPLMNLLLKVDCLCLSNLF